MSGDIFLNIDTIVLRGLNHIDRHALAEALQQALLEQLASEPTLATADLSRVRANISLPTAYGAEQLGQALGQSLSGIITNHEATASPAQSPAQKAIAGGPPHA